MTIARAPTTPEKKSSGSARQGETAKYQNRATARTALTCYLRQVSYFFVQFFPAFQRLNQRNPACQRVAPAKTQVIVAEGTPTWQ